VATLSDPQTDRGTFPALGTSGGVPWQDDGAQNLPRATSPSISTLLLCWFGVCCSVLCCAGVAFADEGSGNASSGNASSGNASSDSASAGGVGAESGRSGEPGASQGVAEIRILGRLDALPRVHLDSSGTTVLGVLTDEVGAAVSGNLRVLGPAAREWQPCLGSAVGKAQSIPIDASGRFCLRAPPLPPGSRVELELSSESHRTRVLELSLAAPLAPPPRILASPEIVDLGGAEELVVTASAEGLSDGERAELVVDCHGERVVVATEGATAGRLRFGVPPSALPGPNACALLVRAGTESSPRPVVLQGRATLAAGAWFRQGGRTRASIRAELRWKGGRRPLDVGVLEVSRHGEHLFTAPISRGLAALEFEDAPSQPLTVRLIRTPLSVRPPEALTLSPPTPWAGWRVLEGAALVGLALWLVLSWRSSPRREPERAPAPSGPSRGKPGQGSVSGHVVDAHTGRPLGAQVRLLLAGPTAEEPLGTTVAGPDGQFELPVARPGGVLRVHASAEGYLPFQGPLGPGAPVLRLVARRRAALSLLTAWFRSKSPREPVPTPLEAGRRALARGSPGVAQWAEEVARAAYAATPPSDADLSALAERKPS